MHRVKPIALRIVAADFKEWIKRGTRLYLQQEDAKRIDAEPHTSSQQPRLAPQGVAAIFANAQRKRTG